MRRVVILMVAGLAVGGGCGCRGSTVKAAPTVLTPDSVGGGGSADLGGGGGTTTLAANPAPLPGAQVPDDPTPPRLRARLDAIRVAITEAQLATLEREVEAECKDHPNDPAPWIAAAAIAYRRLDPRGPERNLRGEKLTDAELKPLRDAIAQARLTDTAKQYEYMCDHLDAVVAMLSGSAAEELRCSQECFRKAPGYLEGRLALAQRLHVAGQIQAAESLIIEATRLWPTRADAWRGLAELYAAEGRFAQVLQCLERARDCDPGNWQLRFQLLQLLLKAWVSLKDHALVPKIRKEFEDLLALMPKIPDAGVRQELEKQLASIRLRVEGTFSAEQIADLEHLPPTERTYAHLFGRVDNFKIRGQLVAELTRVFPDLPDLSARVALLLEVIGQDPEETVRIFALRSLAFEEARSGAPAWPERVLMKVAPHAADFLLALATDVARPDLLRRNALPVLAQVPVEPTRVLRDVCAFGIAQFREKCLKEPKVDETSYNWLELYHRVIASAARAGTPRLPLPDAGPAAWTAYFDVCAGLGR